MPLDEIMQVLITVKMYILCPDISHSVIVISCSVMFQPKSAALEYM